MINLKVLGAAALLAVVPALASSVADARPGGGFSRGGGAPAAFRGGGGGGRGEGNLFNTSGMKSSSSPTSSPSFILDAISGKSTCGRVGSSTTTLAVRKFLNENGFS